jgi:hypothetical protein
VKPVQMTILRKFLGGLNKDIQRWVCSRNPGNFEEAFEIARKEEINLRMSRRKGGNAEWGGNEKVPKYLEDTLARLELLMLVTDAVSSSSFGGVAEVTNGRAA